MIFGVVFIILFTAALFAAPHLIEWQVHKNQTRHFTNKWDYGTYRQFVAEFNKINWHTDNRWEGSLFARDFNSKIHANIISFGGNGMVLGPIDYYKARKFVKIQAKILGRQSPNLWAQKERALKLWDEEG